MRDTLRSPRQQVLRHLLRDVRNLTQSQVAERVAKPQSFVAKYERGECRLSVIEFIDVVRALGPEPSVAIRQLVEAMDRADR